MSLHLVENGATMSHADGGRPIAALVIVASPDGTKKLTLGNPSDFMQAEIILDAAAANHISKLLAGPDAV